MKKGQEPAFPTEVGYENGNPVESFQTGNTQAHFSGISKRFYAACAAMQGLLASMSSDDKNEAFYQLEKLSNKSREFIIASMSYKYADELLKQEEL